MKPTHAVLTFTMALTATVVVSTQHAQHQQPAPPVATAATTTLSAEAVQQLLDGDGMGLAKPAELNGYPGPKHVLELKTELAITAEQERQVQAIRERMLAKAKALGRQIVDAERALDASFKDGRITALDLASRAAAIAKLQGDLRVAHLQAHLETRPVLTAAQARKYMELRTSHH